MTIPRATYRVQLHRDFDFAAAAAIVPYLAELGISHLYSSPILQAEPGSRHGYDIVDHGRINDELGGTDGFARLVEALRRHRLGLVVDIVPNHMSIGAANRWWWDVMARGRSSPYASHFDIDWEAVDHRQGGALCLPVLAAPYEEELAAGRLTVEATDGGPVARYGEQIFPIDPATLPPAAERAALRSDPARLDRLLRAQHYRLAEWRAAASELAYRRFFDVDTLVALRVEREEVFEATHRLILERVAAGEIHGLRVDHPDGLRDPAAYFARLRAAAPEAWIVAEKILLPGERLPDWPVDGTTGYRFANLATNVLVDPATEVPMTACYTGATGADPDWQVVAHRARRDAITALLGSDVRRLGDRWLAIRRTTAKGTDRSPAELCAVIAELAASFPVYRSYVRAEDGTVGDEDRAAVASAALTARERSDVDPELVDELAQILTLRAGGAAGGELAMRFQQLTPAAMAKGVEDTAFYRYLRFVALNEVGGEPGTFGLATDAFHAAVRPDPPTDAPGMLALTTHDTKRSADVRARLAVVAEVPDAWRAAVAELDRLAAAHGAGPDLPGPKVRYLLLQTLVGAWPLSVERAAAYLEKATREAKERTSWTDPDPAFDAAVRSLVEGCLADEAFVAALERFVAPLVVPGRANALAQQLLQLVAPGVPDVYQGGELWDLSLVDPDNRRPVDFAHRERLLAGLVPARKAPDVAAAADDGVPKLWLIHRALRLRERCADDLAHHAAYQPIEADGPAAPHALAVGRGERVVAVVPRLPLTLADAGGWRETTLRLPEGRWRCVLTGVEVDGGAVVLDRLLRDFPVALMERLS